MSSIETAFLMELLYMAALAGLYLFVVPVLAMPVFVSTDGTFFEEFRESFLCTHWFTGRSIFLLCCMGLSAWAADALRVAQ